MVRTADPTCTVSHKSVSRGLGVFAAVPLCLGAFFQTQQPDTGMPRLAMALQAEEDGTSHRPDASVGRSGQDEADEPQFLTVPIRDLQVMHHRVMAHNPLRHEVTESLGDTLLLLFQFLRWHAKSMQCRFRG
jgi:hypothetical protein